MNFLKLCLFLVMAGISPLAFAQTGPWAKYDQQMKDDALYREASAGNLQEVKSIVAGGGNIHYQTQQTKYTILMAAAGSGKIEVVEYLLDLGADPGPKDWWNQTAADKARSVGAKDIEQLLEKAVKKTEPAPVVQKEAPEETVPAPEPAKVDKPVANRMKGSATWPAFGSYKEGDAIIYWVPTGWRAGVVKEVGVKEQTGRISVDYSHRKYLIDPDAYALGNDWHEWTGVVKPQRQPFWTEWFIGNWQIGEVMAHHNDVKDGKETDTYYYTDASESLLVSADQTYRWKELGGKITTGKWVAAKDQPGIILLKAVRGFDWTLVNRTTIDDWGIRKLDIIDLKPSAQVMTVKGKRKTTL